MITKLLAARYASINHSTTRLKIMFAHCSLFIRLGRLSFLDSYKPNGELGYLVLDIYLGYILIYTVYRQITDRWIDGKMQRST